MVAKVSVSSLNGLLPVHKPSGMVSKDVSRWLVKRLGRLKLGHVGTLDPGASGVLPILLGKATRFQDYLLDLTKSYEFDLTFGSETDTLDQDGTVVRTAPCDHVTREALVEAVGGFLGEIEQTPPIYSAVKFKGKPLYDYARGGEGEGVPLEALKRRVKILSFELLDFKPGMGTFRVSCSKGTYVRSLVKDLAEKVGSCGTLTRLIRTRAAGVDLAASVSLETIESCLDDVASLVVPIEQLDLGLPRWRSPRDGLTAKLAAGQQAALEYGDYLSGVEDDEGRAVPGWAKPFLLMSSRGEAFGIGAVRKNEAGRIVIQLKRGL